jgi:hypothetical protein
MAAEKARQEAQLLPSKPSHFHMDKISNSVNSDLRFTFKRTFHYKKRLFLAPILTKLRG